MLFSQVIHLRSRRGRVNHLHPLLALLPPEWDNPPSLESQPTSIAIYPLSMPAKKNAKIVCNNGKEFWITQKEFWKMVREGVVNQTGDFPLTGRFRGRDDQLLIMIQHVVLNKATPLHTEEVLGANRYKKRK